jgi:antirestriction protein ArdC
MATATKTRRRRSAAETQEMQREALSRATTGQSLANWSTIINEFIGRGIPAAEIEPRVNVLTYHAWRALGRQVRKGEKGVKVITWITKDKDQSSDGKAKKFPWSAVVFHISQTDPVAD